MTRTWIHHVRAARPRPGPRVPMAYHGTKTHFHRVLRGRHIEPEEYTQDCSPQANNGQHSSCGMPLLPEVTDMVWAEHLNALDIIAGDRRDDRRYRIEMDLGWKLMHRGRLCLAGTGTVIDFSSGGILFNAGQPLRVGKKIELAIDWPVLLNSTTPMQLIVYGRTVRSLESQVAVRIEQHEFRTRARLSVGPVHA